VTLKKHAELLRIRGIAYSFYYAEIVLERTFLRMQPNTLMLIKRHIICTGRISARNAVNAMGERVTYKSITLDDIILDHSDMILATVASQLVTSIHEFRTFTSLRDTLLSKLMSMEIRAKDVWEITGRSI
jgi:hypothetical protein